MDTPHKRMRKEVNERGKARRRQVPEINVKTEYYCCIYIYIYIYIYI
jgi:hypothetical protein